MSASTHLGELLMKVDLYACSVGEFGRGLAALERVLEKAEAHAKAKGLSEAELLEARLAPDMFPLRRQAQIVIDFAVQGASRAAGLPRPEALSGEHSLNELRAEIAKAKAKLASFEPGQFAGRDDEPVTFSAGQDMTLPTGQYLLGFAHMNFYFHLSIAYAIARHLGADLGKRDLFAAGL
jgi:hypothetical protein